MCMLRTTATLHDDAGEGRALHMACMFSDAASLGAMAEPFFAAPLERGAAAIIIAVPRHAQAMLQRLGQRGIDVEALRAEGRLVCIDAEQTLEQLVRDRRPQREVFEALVRAEVVHLTSQFDEVRAYGELVNLLWHRQQHEAMETLENWWNELIDEFGFSLLCGYRLDPFDDRVIAGMGPICRTHTHLLPVMDEPRFEAAIDKALREVFPDGDAESMKHALAARAGGGAEMPVGQAALMVLQELLPPVAHQVLTSARSHYHRVHESLMG